jgi:hypothetical protein
VRLVHNSKSLRCCGSVSVPPALAVRTTCVIGWVRNCQCAADYTSSSAYESVPPRQRVSPERMGLPQQRDTGYPPATAGGSDTTPPANAGGTDSDEPICLCFPPCRVKASNFLARREPMESTS